MAGGGGVWDFVSKVVGSEANMLGAAQAHWKAKEGFEGAQKTIDEEQRRLQLERDNLISQTTASAAASGLSGDSASFGAYLDFMSSEMQRQAEWTRKAKETELANARESNDWKLGMSLFGSIFDMGSGVGAAAASGNGQWSTGSGSDVSPTYDQIWSQWSGDADALKAWNRRQGMRGAGDFGGGSSGLA